MIAFLELPSEVAMNAVRRPALVIILVVSLVSLLAPQKSQAQLLVTLEMNKKSYLAYEPILATVSVANRAGKDVVLADHDGRSWLSFHISVIGGDAVLPQPGPPRVEPTVLPAGKSVRETVILGRYYPLGRLDNYAIRASVFFNEFGQLFTSNTSAIRINEGQRFWEQQIGVPRSNGQTAYRKFTLLSFQEEQQMSAYVRVRDDRSHRVLATYPLGRLVPHRDPQATLDGQNQLHVLFLTGPRYYRHCVIGPEGEKVSESIYEEKDASLPTLMLANTGAVNVRGGQVFDPNAPPSRPKEVVHRLTERPPGAPAE
jgi:hypothetical protein